MIGDPMLTGRVLFQGISAFRTQSWRFVNLLCLTSSVLQDKSPVILTGWRTAKSKRYSFVGSFQTLVPS